MERFGQQSVKVLGVAFRDGRNPRRRRAPWISADMPIRSEHAVPEAEHRPIVSVDVLRALTVMDSVMSGHE